MACEGGRGRGSPIHAGVSGRPRRGVSRVASMPRQADRRRRPPAAAKRPRVSFWHRLARALPLVLFAMVLSFLLDREGAFRQFESFGLDLAANLKKARRPSGVVVVAINDAAYQNLFGSRSPLNSEGLRRLLDA